MLHAKWNNMSFYPKEFTEARHFAPASPLWRLQEAVTTRFIQVAQQSGAKVALFNQSEAGAYAWQAAWRRVEDTPRNRELYLSHVKLLAEIATREHAWMIPSRRIVERAHNDAHQTRGGITRLRMTSMIFFVRTRS